ncbi:MAG: hypothetical protein IJ598_06225 [Ruminococcus sp.]|nr:hypothetical protein [Ruminococcus sp.]
MKIKSITSAVLAGCLLAASVFPLTGCGKAKESKTEATSAYFSDSFSTIKWPDSTLAKMLPTPESTTGLIDTDRSDWLDVYIGNTTQEQYESYVSSCKEKGFTENYDSGTDYKNCPYYRAENTDGYSLALEYHKEDGVDDFHPMKDTMTIELQPPREEETEAATEKPTEKPTKAPEKNESKPESKADTDSDSVTPSFKETMDSYEAFFDSYIDFMKKYKENPSDLTMITEYSDYISKYSDCMSKLSAVDTDNLSVADLAYYTEVYTRIMKKMAEVKE